MIRNLTLRKITHCFAAAGALLIMSSCGGNEGTTESGDAEAEARRAKVEEAKRAAEADAGKGIGPVKEVTLGPFDQAMADEGKAIFEAKCSACHRTTEEKIVGPGLKGVTKIRKPEWIMNMIINPEEMTKKDPTAMDLLAEHLTQMTNQDVSEADARKLLEYMRQIDEVDTKAGAEDKITG